MMITLVLEVGEFDLAVVQVGRRAPIAAGVLRRPPRSTVAVVCRCYHVYLNY